MQSALITVQLPGFHPANCLEHGWNVPFGPTGYYRYTGKKAGITPEITNTGLQKTGNYGIGRPVIRLHRNLLGGKLSYICVILFKYGYESRALKLRKLTIECNGDGQRLSACVSAFLRESDFSVKENERHADQKGSHLMAKSNKRRLLKLLASPRPDSVEVDVLGEKPPVSINLAICPSRAIRLCFHASVLIATGLLALAMHIAMNLARCGDRGGTRWAAIGVFIAWSIMFLILTNAPRVLGVGRFVGKLNDHLSVWTESPPKIHGCYPDSADILMALALVTVILLFTMFASEIATILFFGGILLLSGLLGLIVLKFYQMGRFFSGLVGLSMGLLVTIYSTLPYGATVLVGRGAAAGLTKYLPAGWLEGCAYATHMGLHDAMTMFQEAKASGWHILGMVIVYAGVPLALIALGTVLFRHSPVEFIKSIEKIRMMLVTPDENRGMQMRLNMIAQIGVWVALAPLNLIGIYLAFSAFELAAIGHNTVFPSYTVRVLFENAVILTGVHWGNYISCQSAITTTRALLLAYSIPVVCLFGLAIGGTSARVFNVGRASPVPSDLPEHVATVLVRIAEYGRIRTPCIRIIETKGIGASIRVPIMPFSRAQLTLSKGSFDALTEMEMGCLIAHEIGHLKQARAWYIRLLNIISRMSLMGNGWLLGGVDFLRGEAEADAFALSWSEEGAGNGGYAALLSLLRKLKQQEMAIALNLLDRCQDEEPRAITVPWLREDIRRHLADYGKYPLWKRFRTAVCVYYQVYLGDAILLYLHPRLDDRIVAIENSKQAC